METNYKRRFHSLFKKWRLNQRGAEVIHTLNSMSDILEQITEEFFKTNQDKIGKDQGQPIKTMIKNENHAEITNKLAGEYIMSGCEFDPSPLHMASCRLLLDLLPGLETSVVFLETEGLVARLISWAETAEEPLRSYATGLLGWAMEIPEVDLKFVKQNTRLVPLMMQRLHQLRALQEKMWKFQKKVLSKKFLRHHVEASKYEWRGFRECEAETDGKTPTKNDTAEYSNSCLAEASRPYSVAYSLMPPLSATMRQLLIIQYLIPMGGSKKLLTSVIEHHVMDLIFLYMNVMENPDIVLALSAYKYLTSLLRHEEFENEFKARGGGERLRQFFTFLSPRYC